jgi:hypothetical protein
MAVTRWLWDLMLAIPTLVQIDAVPNLNNPVHIYIYVLNVCHVFEVCFKKQYAPNVGLEPTTLRLKVSCSTG